MVGLDAKPEKTEKQFGPSGMGVWEVSWVQGRALVEDQGAKHPEALRT